MRWTLPKGTPDQGETVEQTALREVDEETGLTSASSSPLGSIHYSFVQRGTRIDKTVHYFLMVPTGGDLAGHDQEFDEVRWVAVRRGRRTSSASRRSASSSTRAAAPAIGWPFPGARVATGSAT